MRVTSVWKRLIGVDGRTVVEDVEFDDDADAVVVLRATQVPKKRRCGRCHARSSGYDAGDGWRRWRGVDLGTVKVFLEADAPRVCCDQHGVTVAVVRGRATGRGGSFTSAGAVEPAAYFTRREGAETARGPKAAALNCGKHPKGTSDLSAGLPPPRQRPTQPTSTNAPTMGNGPPRNTSAANGSADGTRRATNPTPINAGSTSASSIWRPASSSSTGQRRSASHHQGYLPSIFFGNSSRREV